MNTDYIADQYLDQGLKTYVAILENENNAWEYFICEAEDADHAEEQAENAYPEYPVLWINRGLNFSMEDVYEATILRNSEYETINVNAQSEDEVLTYLINIYGDEFKLIRTIQIW